MASAIPGIRGDLGYAVLRVHCWFCAILPRQSRPVASFTTTRRSFEGSRSRCLHNIFALVPSDRLCVGSHFDLTNRPPCFWPVCSNQAVSRTTGRRPTLAASMMISVSSGLNRPSGSARRMFGRAVTRSRVRSRQTLYAVTITAIVATIAPYQATALAEIVISNDARGPIMVSALRGIEDGKI